MTKEAIKLSWLPDMDLNHDKQIQSLLCYRYTIGQWPGREHKVFPRGVKLHHAGAGGFALERAPAAHWAGSALRKMI